MSSATSMSRRRFVGSALAGASALAFGSAQAQSAKYRLRYGTAFPATHPGVIRIIEASELIKKQTNGLVDLQVYPNSQLGSEPDMFSQVRSGALDFMSTSGVNQTVVPIGGINAVAFAFESYDQVWSAMDGDLGNHVRGEFAKVGLHVLPKCLDNGYRNITSGAKPITSPDDLKGFKIRVPGNPLWVTLFKTLGAAPTPINFGELYAALQTRIVDGQENPLALIQSAKLYEVQKYCSLTNHMWDGFWFLANRRAWEAVPADMRAIVAKHINAAAVKEREDVAKLNAGLQAELASKGLTFNQPNVAPFRDKLRTAGFYAEWKGKYGDEAWALLEKAVGKLS